MFVCLAEWFCVLGRESKCRISQPGKSFWHFYYSLLFLGPFWAFYLFSGPLFAKFCLFSWVSVSHTAHFSTVGLFWQLFCSNFCRGMMASLSNSRKSRPRPEIGHPRDPSLLKLRAMLNWIFEIELFLTLKLYLH